MSGIANQNKTAGLLSESCCLLSFGFSRLVTLDLVVHAAHTAHAAAAWRHRWASIFRWHLGNDCFGGQQQAADRRCVLQRRTSDFRWVNHASFDEVNIFASGDVVTFVAGTFFDFGHDERAFLTCVISKLAKRGFDGAFYLSGL